MTKREEAAQALYQQQTAGMVAKSQFWDLPDSTQDKYYAAVDAVIACIREPDEKMTHAGANELDSEWHVREAWQAMLDAMGG